MIRSRRFFLGGAAVAISLPPFESLLSRTARAEAGDPAARPQRILTLFVPNGADMENWVPKQQGENFELPSMLTPLAKIKNKLLVLSNLANMAGDPGGTGDHAAGTGAVFNCAVPARADGAKIKAGISVDQVAAKRLGTFTRTPSLQLGVQDGRNNGVCEYGFSCVYENTISWATETQPLQQTTNPAAVFQTLFAGFDPEATLKGQAERLARKKSILDFVRNEATLVAGKLGRADRVKLDQFTTGLRELEKRVEAGGATGAACGSLSAPAPGEVDIPKRSRLMNELIAAAFQCDATRVISHILGPAYPGRSYNFMGVAKNHHSVSHFKSSSDRADYQKIQAWHMGEVADLLERLDAIPEGAGTVLDNTMVIQSSDCGNPRAHDHRHLPIYVAGGAGAFKMGRHIAYPSMTPLANLFVSVLNALGVPTQTFGKDGTGPLPNLT